MKKLIYVAFCLVLAMGVGCAITDYDVITDNDQGSQSDPAGSVVNTNGKAKITPSAQIATSYSDGNDELFSMINQKADGTASITTYNNFSTGSGAIFHDDLYCNPDWNGCSIFTAADDNDGNLFDGSINGNCSGARSLSLLLSTSRYYGECGRSGLGNKMDLASKMDLINTFELGKIGSRQALIKYLTPVNTNFFLQKDGQQINMPFFGGYQMSILPNRSVHIDATNSLNQRNYDTAATIVNQYGPGQYNVTIEIEGISATWQVSPLSPERIKSQGLGRY